MPVAAGHSIGRYSPGKATGSKLRDRGVRSLRYQSKQSIWQNTEPFPEGLAVTRHSFELDT